MFALVVFAAAQVRAMGSAQVPTDVETIEVAEGETLSGIAERAAPEAPSHQVVDRIMELNSLDSAALQTGESLLVPAGSGR